MLPLFHLEHNHQYFCLHQGDREILLSLTSKNISMGDQVKAVLLQGFTNTTGNQLSSDTSDIVPSRISKSKLFNYLGHRKCYHQTHPKHQTK